MGERDAFGREIGEDPLAGLGWTPPEPQRAQPAPNWVPPKPAPAPTPFDAGEAWSVRGPQQPPQQRAPRVRRRRQRGFSRLILFLVLLVIVGASAGSLFQLGSDAVKNGKGLLDSIPTAAPPVTRTEPEQTLGEGSMFNPAKLRKAIAQLPNGRATIVTVRQDGLTATLKAGGKSKLVNMTADGNLTTVDAPVAIPGKSIKLDPAAPARIVRTVTRRTGRDADSISQLVLTNGSWTLQFPDGLQFTANAKGTKVRRLT